MANGKDDIRVAIGMPRHPKTLQLIEEAGERAAWALIALWCFAGENRPDGVLRSAGEAEVASGWRGKRGSFHAALVSCGWLEADGVTLHDWQDEQPWIAGRSNRIAAATVNGAKGGAAKAAKSRHAPSGTGSGLVADHDAAPSGPKADSASLRSPPSAPLPPLPPTAPTPPQHPEAAAADSSPPTGGGPEPIASRLAARIRWTDARLVGTMLDELRAEGDSEAFLEAALDATASARMTPYDWAKATRKRRGAAKATDDERIAAQRTAESWARRALDFEAAGDTARASGAWAQVQFAAKVLGKKLEDFGWKPPSDTTTAACERERHAPLTARRPRSLPFAHETPT